MSDVDNRIFEDSASEQKFPLRPSSIPNRL